MTIIIIKYNKLLISKFIDNIIKTKCNWMLIVCNLQYINYDKLLKIYVKINLEFYSMYLVL